MSFRLDDKLIAMDVLATRHAAWGLERYPMHQLERFRLLHEGQVLGGGPDAMPRDIAIYDEELEEMRKDVPHLWQTLLAWYISRLNAQQMAGRLGISKASVWTVLGNARWHMLGRLKGRDVKV